jgi:NAD(P)-dependent dehydrogenase (short-subunit alcohol dehydrogenase family)
VLAREGASVLLADIHLDRAEETLRMIEAEGGTATTFAGDMTNSGDCQAMVEVVLHTFGRLDILVNNIGAAIAGNLVDTSEEDWDRILDVSLRTAFLASKAAVPAMAARGGGAIVNVGSISGFRGGNYVGYSAAKGGMHALTVDMAFSHGRQGIRVNAVAPGHITTPLLYSVTGHTAETDFRQRLAAASNLLGTEGTAWDVASAVTFLASDEARWITGATLPVDAGVMAVTPLMMAPRLGEVEPPA